MALLHPLFLSFLYLCSGVHSQTPVTVTDIRQNLTYQGFSDYGVDQFLNVRYGQDTSGANRFKHPVAYQYPSGTTIDATKAGASCPQNTLTSLAGSSFNSGVYQLSEDCLNLRVARPAGVEANAGLPIMVWIYGGSDENGSDNYTLYDPLALVAGAAEKDTPVLFVSMNYRVNVFGFANNSALAAEKSQNSGLFDQRLALDWVRDNIAVFGGDPNRVMLFGQSDGGTSTGIHLTSYGGKGNISFSSGVMESDAATGDPGVSGNYTLGSTITVASLAGCKGNDTSIIECMRALPMDTLLDAVLQYENITSSETAQDIFFPTVDHDLIPAPPSELLREGKFHKVPIMTGWAFNDGAIFTPSTINSSDFVFGYLQANYPYFTNETIEELLALYPIEDFSANTQSGISPYYFQAAEIFRDANFACGSVFIAQQFAKQGMPAYLYDFNITAYGDILAEGNATFEGVIHTSDIAFVFNIATFLANNSADVAQTQPLVSGSWAQFATTHDPSGKNASNSLQGWTTAFASTDAAKADNVTEVNLRVIGGPYNGQVNLTNNHTDGPEPNLLNRCAFINTPSFYESLRT